jgi:hypothetical protein
MSDLTKTTFTAERHPRRNEAEVDAILFVSEYDDDDPERFRAITIDLDVDTDLGSPEILTVTLQPGDVLNT